MRFHVQKPQATSTSKCDLLCTIYEPVGDRLHEARPRSRQSSLGMSRCQAQWRLDVEEDNPVAQGPKLPKRAVPDLGSLLTPPYRMPWIDRSMLRERSTRHDNAPTSRPKLHPAPPHLLCEQHSWVSGVDRRRGFCRDNARCAGRVGRDRPPQQSGRNPVLGALVSHAASDRVIQHNSIARDCR